MRQKIDARHRRDTSKLIRGSIAILLLTNASFVHAAPSGGEVTAGSGAISQAGNAVTIDQSSSRLAINWQSFNIGSDESVTFNQPSSQAIALNRILGQDPSTILGSLSANGQVFLLNPNGVLFGAGAQVDVGGIVASTLSLSNDDFLAGHYTFAGDADAGAGGDTFGAGVVNQGNITASQGGYVAFIAPSVTNEGVIRANGGTVALGAGSQVTLNLADNQLVGFTVDKAALGALAQNRQLIQADGGTVILSALAKDALLSSVVNNDGVIEARSVSSRDGVIRLDGGDSGVVSVAGSLDASGTGAGETGGRITVSGDKVALLDGARLDASGAAGGGSVRSAVVTRVAMPTYATPNAPLWARRQRFMRMRSTPAMAAGWWYGRMATRASTVPSAQPAVQRAATAASSKCRANNSSVSTVQSIPRRTTERSARCCSIRTTCI